VRTLRYYWQYRTDILWSLLCATGLWRVWTEGGYYRDGYWQWAFWKPYRFKQDYGWKVKWPFLGYLGWVELRLPCAPHPEPWYVALWRKCGLR
jgi:hypothetical protein